MVDKKISNFCYPIKIKMGKEMKNGTLVLNVFHGKELEIEYKKKEIMDKINTFFGFNCISKIVLKIVEEEKSKKGNKLIKIRNLSKISKKIDKINNNQLKTSLSILLKAFDDKNK